MTCWKDNSPCPVVSPFTADRDAFANHTEGFSTFLGTGASDDGATLLVDISGLSPGTTVRLIVRLVNNDDDHGTSVRIDSPSLVAAPPYLYKVPGLAGETTAVTFTVTGASTPSANEFGVVVTDDALGRVDGLLPGATAYSAVVLGSARRLIVFPQNPGVGATVTLTLPAGAMLLPYVVVNGTTLEALRDNPYVNLGLVPTWFGAPAANTDFTNHFLRSDDSVAGTVSWAIEDGIWGGEGDFDDLVVSLAAAPASAPPKFFVADRGADATFAYNAGGSFLTLAGLGAGQTEPRDVSSEGSGNRQWVVDANQTVAVYDRHGTLIGSWQATDLASPEGIATDGTDLWIVEGGAAPRLRFYEHAALRLGGTATATSTFALAAGNSQPTGVTTDGAVLWVSDAAGQVFVYDPAGPLLGQWSLDPANTAPRGLTLNPSGGSDLWVVDGVALRVYRYADALPLRSGSASAADSFALAPGNDQPQGVADPEPGGRTAGGRQSSRHAGMAAHRS